MEKINEFKNIGIKHRTSYYFNEVNKIEDFDFD